MNQDSPAPPSRYDRDTSPREAWGGARGQGFGLVGTMQNPWASMPSAGLNLLRKFSMAIAAVSSTICASVNCVLRRANSASSTLRPVIVMHSAYSSASRSSALNSVLSRHARTSPSLSVPPSVSVSLTELMSIQNGQPLSVATRT